MLRRTLGGPVGTMLILATGYVVMLASVRDKSATFDEPGHAFAGYAYWKTGDYRFDPENGHLPQRWFGLAIRTLEPALPAPDASGWATADVWRLADVWLHRTNNDASTILMRGRAAAALIAVALGWIIWRWSRKLFGPIGGMIALLLFALNPTVLAHGPLMTSDMATALFFALSLGSFCAMLERMTAWRVLASALATGGLLLTKTSGVLIVPVLLVLAVIKVLGLAPLQTAHGPIIIRWQKLLLLGAAAVAHVGVAAGLIWGAFGFRYQAAPADSPHARFHVPWEALLDQPALGSALGQIGLTNEQRVQVDEMLRTHGGDAAQWTYATLDVAREIKSRVLLPQQVEQLSTALARPPLSLSGRLLQYARDLHLLPEAYIYGYAHVWKFSRGRASFLNGQINEAGSRTFFPYALAVKTPLAQLGLLALAITAIFTVAPQRSRPALLPHGLLIVVYSAAAITSEINLGLRHLLPIFPSLFILGGGAGHWLCVSSTRTSVRWIRFAVAGLLVVLVAEMTYRFPNYLAYFNGLVSPAEGFRHLIDSSLDWGQELPALKRRIDWATDPAPHFLAYFGTASPQSHGITAQALYSYLDGDRATSPAFKLLFGPQDDASLVAALQQMPAYDPSLVVSVRAGAESGSLVVKRASALRLSGGTYYISASLLQPVHYPRAFGFWTAEHESTYQALRETMTPLLSDQRGARAAAINRFPPEQWNQLAGDSEEYRFARLAAWLRSRSPNDHVNIAILVFRMSEADLEIALDGPPPLGR